MDKQEKVIKVENGVATITPHSIRIAPQIFRTAAQRKLVFEYDFERDNIGDVMVERDGNTYTITVGSWDGNIHSSRKWMVNLNVAFEDVDLLIHHVEAGKKPNSILVDWRWNKDSSPHTIVEYSETLSVPTPTNCYMANSFDHVVRN